MKKKADIIIISYNTCELTLQCIETLFSTSDNYIEKVIVVDNHSTDDSVQKISEKYPEVIIIKNPENFGYSRAVNIGFSKSVSDIVFVSNSDIIYHKDSIKILIETLISNEKYGVVGPKQLYPNGKYQFCYSDLPGTKLGLKDMLFISHIQNLIRRKIVSKRLKKVPYIDGALMAIKSRIFKSVNGFDEDYFFYSEEADFCDRVRKKGFDVIHNPNSVITHYRGATVKYKIDMKRIEMLISSKVLFCNKNLSKINTKFFIIFEIFYCYNFLFMLRIIKFFTGKKLNDKIKIYKLFARSWIYEFNKFLEVEK